MILQLDGRSLYYELHGEAGPWVVLLHHGLGSTRAWGGQVRALAGAGFCVLAYDRWGYGRSSPRPGFPPDFLAREPLDLHSLLRRLGIQSVHLVGHSDGGTIALLFAARYPQAVQRMVLIAAHIYNEAVGRAALAETLERYRSDPEFRSSLSAIHGSKAEQLVQDWLGCWLGAPTGELNLRSQLADIRSPTLVVQGEKDEFATQQQARDIAEGIAGSDLWIVPGCSHQPHAERPREFNQRMIEFLRPSSADRSRAQPE